LISNGSLPERSSEQGERNVDVFPVEKARLLSSALARVERKARLDLPATEQISDDLVTAAHQPIAVSPIVAPEVERREAVRNRAKAPGLAEEEGLKIELRADVPHRASLLSQRPDVLEVVMVGQAGPIVSNDHAGWPPDRRRGPLIDTAGTDAHAASRWKPFEVISHRPSTRCHVR
jgi:hypothetical protein